MGIGAAVGGIASGIMGANSADKAADAQSQAAEASLQLQRDMFNLAREDFTPYKNAGKLGLTAMMYEMGLGPKPTGKVYQGFQETPGYQFQFDQGTEAVNALAGARGGLNSGRTMQELTGFGQGLANQEYGNYLNRLGGITNMGTSAAANTASAGQNMANGGSNALMAGGQAQANGYINSANAISGGINNALGAYQYQQMLGTLGK